MKEAINEFCQREYGTNADFSDPYKVGIAYTEDELGYSIWVYVDTISKIMYKDIEGAIVDEVEVEADDIRLYSFDELVARW